MTLTTDGLTFGHPEEDDDKDSNLTDHGFIKSQLVNVLFGPPQSSNFIAFPIYLYHLNGSFCDSLAIINNIVQFTRSACPLPRGMASEVDDFVD
ncbi:hypothetical protein EVAR_68670_1 [Eumeta japonica]|uniref:Uncharacterized protein n=1 Tax=Eumeta variegata TaxID=151549 RepID=A0A4C1TC58_EUMVA|nr:hypothetical protein EVAR_68670_1 [Eumeta japonica]